MPIKALYNCIRKQHVPIMLASDFYAKTIAPSIESESESVYYELITCLEYDFKVSKGDCVSWRDADDIRLLPGYMSLFRGSDECYCVMFESLYFIYLFVSKNKFKGSPVHVFYFMGNVFAIKLQEKTAYVFTPKDVE